jgi:HSP20 family protein
LNPADADNIWGSSAMRRIAAQPGESIMARLSVYDPFAEVFPELFRGLLAPARAAAPEALEIRIEVRETANAYQVQAELPGVRKDDIQVQIDGNRVSISAEVRREAADKPESERVLRSERFYGQLARSFALASEIDDKQASAKFEQGILTLTLPKQTAPSARRITIQ